jgi:hypothetical protein
MVEFSYVEMHRNCSKFYFKYKIYVVKNFISLGL